MVAGHGFDIGRFDEMAALGDPLADELVAPLLDEPGGEKIRQLMRTLVDNDQIVPSDLPIDVQDYLTESARMPEWADPGRIERGQAVFERWGPEFGVALFCASLPSAYASKKGVNVLAQTARLETDTRRRIMETGQFLIDVMAPGGLGESGKGVRTIQHVRLMHAAIRHLIKAHARDAKPVPPAPWNNDWGLPINQMELAGTLMSFAYPATETFPKMGIELSAGERDDYLHVWRVIGHMLGVHQTILPTDEAEAALLVTTIRERTFGRSEAGVEMTAALIGLLKQMTPLHIFDDISSEMIRMLIGDKTADLLDVSAGRRFYGLLGFLKVILRFSSHELEQHKALRGLANEFGFTVLEGMLDFERGGTKRPPFDIPDHLRRPPGQTRSRYRRHPLSQRA